MAIPQRVQRGAIHGVGGFALGHSAAVLLPLLWRPGGGFGIVRAEGHAEIDPEREAREIVRLQGLAVSFVQPLVEELAGGRACRARRLDGRRRCSRDPVEYRMIGDAAPTRGRLLLIGPGVRQREVGARPMTLGSGIGNDRRGQVRSIGPTVVTAGTMGVEDRLNLFQETETAARSKDRRQLTGTSGERACRTR